MSTPEDTPPELNDVDELARKRAEHASVGDLELRARVREDARRNARRSAAAERARRRAGAPGPPHPSGSGGPEGPGGASGAA